MGKWQVVVNMERRPSPAAFLHAFARLGEQLFSSSFSVSPRCR
jgi:hypothetical protein